VVGVLPSYIDSGFAVRWDTYHDSFVFTVFLSYLQFFYLQFFMFQRSLLMDQPEILDSFLSGRVLVLVGDITTQNVDAIVNAANSTLLGGGGVDGAIHRKGGPQILEQCREIRRTRYPDGLPTGEVVLTSGGRLAARHVIHTVGPITRPGQKPDASLLAACYRNSLALAASHGFRSIAFPAISTGVYGYPRHLAAPVVSETIESALAAGTVVKEVRLVFYQPDDARVFLENQRFTLNY
jgi:O-acetyl-ADP-ribose deacetylase